MINPITFAESIAPNIATQKNEVALMARDIIERTDQELSQSSADQIIIEGAGGWFTPISNKETMADLAIGYSYPVILVVGMKLSCVNHALLT